MVKAELQVFSVIVELTPLPLLKFSLIAEFDF
jgi:hypothetical protein